MRALVTMLITREIDRERERVFGFGTGKGGDQMSRMMVMGWVMIGNQTSNLEIKMQCI